MLDLDLKGRKRQDKNKLRYLKNWKVPNETIRTVKEKKERDN
jgi:hypothetical protein